MSLPDWLPKVYRRTAKAGDPWSFGNWGKGFIDPISNQTHVWNVGGKAADSSRGFMGSPHHVEMAATLHGVPQDRVEAASDPNYDTYRERFYHSPITIAPNGQYCSSNAFNGGYEPDGEEGRFESEYTPLRYISDTGAWEEDNNGSGGYGHAPNMASWHEAGLTGPQRQRAINEWDVNQPDQSSIVHEFPNGWSIRKLNTVGDKDREGSLMRNCWQMRAPGVDYLGSNLANDSLADDAGRAHYSLRDENNYPRVSYYTLEPLEPGGIGQIQEAFGHGNSAIKPEHAQMLKEWADQNNIDTSSAVGRAAERLAATYAPNQWMLTDEQPGQCPYCHKWATENPCEHCHSDISVNPIQRNYPLNYEEYPIPVRKGLASWHEAGQAKIAANGVFYHTAPSKYRKQIEEQGLLPTNETPHSPWADTRHEWSAPIEQPPGVYLHDDPRNALGYAYTMAAQNTDDPYPGDNPDGYYNEDDYDWSGQPDYDEDPEGNENFEPRYNPKPAYDIWKVDARGLPMHIDPEGALMHGSLTPEEAQRQINKEKRKYQNPEMTEGHRWFTPNPITPDRIQLHDSVYPKDMTENNFYDTIEDQKRIPEAWGQVPLNEWNEKARQRYLGEPVE